MKVSTSSGSFLISFGKRDRKISYITLLSARHIIFNIVYDLILKKLFKSYNKLDHSDQINQFVATSATFHTYMIITLIITKYRFIKCRYNVLSNISLTL